jgi:dTDP-4-amino-4,6-dideoxygalactose transaminase
MSPVTSHHRALAILGGPPSFSETLHVGRPHVGGREGFLRRAQAMLDRRWLTNNGPYVVELEERIAARIGVKHCVVVSSGTTALGLLARAARLTGEVIVPSFTFVATAHAFDWLGIVPVFCDIDADTWTLNASACEAAIGPSTSAIIGVHTFGRPCDVSALGAVAVRHDLPLFFDAAHAFGCTHDHRHIGSFGDAEVFSFHATKVFHTFEGGAVTTNHDWLAAELRLLRNFGFNGYDTVGGPGINGKMPEVCAAMGLANLDVFGETVEASRVTFERYREGLAGIPGLTLRDHETTERRNWHYVVVEVDHEAFGLDRDALVRALEAENVLARRYFYPGVHAMEPYRTRDPEARGRLPQTVRVAARAMALPAGSEIARDHVDAICTIVRAAGLQAPAVLKALGSPRDLALESAR